MARKILNAALAAFSALFLAAPLLAQSAGATADPYAFTQDYEPQPAMWRLSDEDTTIYMLGTIHILPPGFRWRNSQLDSIIEQAEMLVVETTDADGDQGMMAMAPKLSAMSSHRVPTSQQLSPAVRGKWRQLVEMSGLHFPTIDNMPLMVAMLSFGQAASALDPSSYEYGVETVLEREFNARGRPIQSIEDFGQVMYGLFRVNDAEAVRELERELAAWQGKSIEQFYGVDQAEPAADGYWAMEHAWARGEVADDFDIGLGRGKINEAFNEVLLVRRNTAWAEWLDQRLDQPGTILLAVGAGHFEGPDSVLAKLGERGLTAERIN